MLEETISTLQARLQELENPGEGSSPPSSAGHAHYWGGSVAGRSPTRSSQSPREYRYYMRAAWTLPTRQKP